MADSTCNTRGNVHSKNIFIGDDAFEKAETCILEYEKKTLTTFVKVKAPKSMGLPVMSELATKRIFWEEHSSKELPISFDGRPFSVLGCQIRECCHGPDRHRSEKKKAKTEKDSKKADHDYSLKRLRNLVQSTKKMDCPAKIQIRSIIRFPDYQINHNSEWCRKKQSKQLRSDLHNRLDVSGEYCVYVAFPPMDAHRNHLNDEEDCITHNVDKLVIQKIHSLVDDGVKDVGEMKRHINSFSRANFPGVPLHSNRFFPNNRALRNHMYAASSLSQFSREDQENLQQHVNAWRKERPDDCFYFVPSPKTDCMDNDVEDFIFVHQAAWQRRLLGIYGNEICLLDATYCICKCNVALFFICVSTNVGYITVGCFLLPDETVKSISRGLNILKQWNRDWSPAFFMTDYDQREISAIENTFPDCFTYLCNFHREQSWERWLKSCTGLKKYKKSILQMMRNIAHADCEESFNTAMASLRESEYWNANERFRVWFEKQWLSVVKRWVYYHRQSLRNIRVSTTNGLERQHYELKQNYLKNYTGSTITSLIKTVTNHFLPDSYKRYKENNIRCLNTSRKYSDTVPKFLHDRPHLFRDHCIKRLSSAMIIPLSDISPLGGKQFIVLSSGGSTEYRLDLSKALPVCTCPDWKKYHLPCKHMLSIIIKVKGCGWDSLSDQFTKSSHVNVDVGVCGGMTASLTQTSSSSEVFGTPASNTTLIHTNRSEKKETVALGSRCKMLSSSIHRMLHLIQKSSDYEPIYKDLMDLHSRIRKLVPREAGMLKRPSRPGRKPSKYGVLKQRRKYRKKTLKTAEQNVTVSKKNSPVRPRVVPLESSLQFDEHLPDKTASSTEQTVILHDSEKNYYRDSHENASEERNSLETPAMYTSAAVPDVESYSKFNATDPQDIILESTESEQPTAEAVLQNILRSAPTDSLIMQIGPYSITDSSIHYLNSTLSDEPPIYMQVDKKAHFMLKWPKFWDIKNSHVKVIDACLYMMATENVYHIDCAIMTAIFEMNGSQESTSFLPKLQLQKYDALIGAVNEEGVHWVLMIIIPGAKRLVYLNPLGEQAAKIRGYQRRWHTFLKERHNRHIERNLGSNGWQVETVPHSKQQDSSSCGVFVIKFAEQYLSGETKNMIEMTNDLPLERKKIQLKLLSRGIQEQDMLRYEAGQTDTLLKERAMECTQAHKTTRKRKRKDERKSSIFLYEMPRKITKKLRFCVCRKENDGRKYWKCDECDEWYHPQCMGMEEKDEPEVYICPGCQVKNSESKDKVCPSLTDLQEDLLDSIAFEENDLFDENCIGDLLGGSSGFTPMHFNNPIIQCFYDIEMQRGHNMEIKHSGWGPFLLIPDNSLEDFFSFRKNFNVEELLCINIPLLYYLNNYGKDIKVMHVTKNVVKLDPFSSVDQYKEWLKEMKDQLS